MIHHDLRDSPGAFAARMEMHMRDAEISQENKLEGIKKEELAARCSLSSDRYARANNDKRKALRASAMSLKLSRWLP